MTSDKRAEWRRMCRAMPLALMLIGAPALAAAADQTAAPPAPAVAPPATTATFLALSDIHYVGTANETCGQAGDETDDALWSAAQAEAQRVIQAERPAFAIYLGDLPSHCTPHPDSQFTVALDGLANIAGAGTKLIYVPGNNDALDGDYYPFADNAGQTPLDRSTAWGGKPVLNARPGDMIDVRNLSKGYYAAYAVQASASAPALRVIALNTTIFTAKYGQRVPGRQAESDAQLDWLDAQLKDARAKKEKVIIAMHVPPGTDGYGGRDGDQIITMWDSGLIYTGQDPDLPPKAWVQQVFLQLVASYRAEIVGLLSSHTHYNEIRRLRDCSQTPSRMGAFTELDVAIPSITTDHGNNPSVKLFGYDGAFEWTENRTYYAPAKTGAGWDTNPVLSFDQDNYPCPSCTAGDSLFARIATLTAGKATSGKLPGQMMKWLKVGAGPAGAREYLLAMDATCDIPGANAVPARRLRLRAGR